MKKKLLAILISLITLSVHAVMLPDGTDARINDIVINDEGFIEKAYLSTPTVINTSLGMIEATGEVVFNKEGKVIEFTPSENGTAKTPVGVLNYKGNWGIKFYDSGCIYGIGLSTETILTINNTDYYCSSDNLLSFYDGWKPSSFTVSKEIPLHILCGDIVIKKDTHVFLNPDGSILLVKLAAPTLLTTAAGDFTAIDSLVLYSDGTVRVATALKSDKGLSTKYGKVYPQKNTDVSFSINGEIYTVTPQDITIITIEGETLFAVANKEMVFFNNGDINAVTIKGKNIKIYGWSLEFADDEFQLIVYPNEKIYFNNVYINAINDKKFDNDTYNPKSKKLLVDKKNCYYWNTGLDKKGYSWSSEYNSCSVYLLSKDDLKEKLVVKINDGTPSNFDVFGDFDFYDCPLLFDDKDKVIGYRRATTKPEDWDPVTDRYRFDERYNKETQEFENYREDIFFDQQAN